MRSIDYMVYDKLTCSAVIVNIKLIDLTVPLLPRDGGIVSAAFVLCVLFKPQAQVFGIHNFIPECAGTVVVLFARQGYYAYCGEDSSISSLLHYQDC